MIAARCAGGTFAMIDAISRRLRRVTSATTSRPAAVSKIVTSRRFAGFTRRRAKRLRTSRSHRRVAVDGWIRSSRASSPTFSPASARSSTTNARNCGNVTESSTAAIDLDATATNALDDDSTASVTASNSASTDLDPGICAYYNSSS